MGLRPFTPKLLAISLNILLRICSRQGKERIVLYKITKLLKVVNDAAAALRTRLYYTI